MKLAAIGFLSGGVILIVMILPVYDQNLDGAQSRGLTDTSDFNGFIPWHMKFLHPATTQYWRVRGYLPILTIARYLFYGSIFVGFVTFCWFLWGAMR